MKLKFLERINFVSPVKIQIGVEMDSSDNITFRPRSKEISEVEVEEIPEPDIRKELPSREDQDMFEELLMQQRDALKRTIEDLGAVITAYKTRIAEHEEMIQKATQKLEHINGLTE